MPTEEGPSTGLVLFLAGLLVAISTLHRDRHSHKSKTYLGTGVELRVENKDNETIITATPKPAAGLTSSPSMAMIVGPAKESVEKKAPGLKGKVLSE
jgi:hypothetical protein